MSATDRSAAGSSGAWPDLAGWFDALVASVGERGAPPDGGPGGCLHGPDDRHIDRDTSGRER